MSSWLNETRLVQQLAESLLIAKKTRYQDDLITMTAVKTSRNKYKTLNIDNKFGEKIKTTVFIPDQHSNSKCCVLYLHGYGSHRLQALPILSFLPKSFGLCCFDFSGSGKSQGDASTFGFKESLDIESVIEMLQEQFGFQKIVMWGRSMGAVASILYNSNNLNGAICLQVLDSPFCSFQTMAMFYGKQVMNLPQIILNFGIKILKDRMSTYKYNPFCLNMCQSIKKTRIPSLFVYSQEDEVVPSQNSIQIINNYPQQCIYEKLIIKEDHNTFRSKETLCNILSIVHKYAKTEKVKQKSKSKKGFSEIISAVPNSPKDKRIVGYIDCSLSKKKRINNPQNSPKYQPAFLFKE